MSVIDTYLNAIIICNVAGKIQAFKYRNIRSVNHVREKFERVIAWKKPGATHVNYYWQNKQFYLQVKNPTI